MQFSLSLVSILLLAPSAFALVAPTDEIASFSNEAISLPVEEVFGSDDAAGVVTDGTIEKRLTHCSNNAKIKKDKSKYKGKCQPSKSLGWKSSHNCKGKSYLCVQNGRATCYSIRDAKGMENGECFK